MQNISESTIRIVIVEDHEFTRIGLKMGLEQVQGLSVIAESEDGRDGLKTVMELKPDVVLMDIELPHMDGIEATRRIRKELPDTRVIMLTSHSSDQEIFAALSAGANGYCLKNISSAQLGTVVRSVAEGAVWLDPGIANRVLCAYASDKPNGAAPANGGSNTSTRTRTRERSNTRLSPREIEVLRLVAQGLSNQKIADQLELGLETVKTHMRHIMEKLTVSDRTEAAVKAMREGLF
ncbi:MAG: response regulator transcription factor [Candidatus Melainabacteria bacterium]|jgi:DNA-binding NarL/FixJ family response regulator|nr:response regulator transcription factor [Candidatus Melainabacteria bacterium]